MENKWKAIAGRLQKSKQKNVDEDTYQDTIECQFQLLGWYDFETRPPIPSGSSGTLKPDIVLNKDGKRVLPIEIKRPTNNIRKRQIIQLSSYMRQLRLSVGLYIGENIRLYYDAPDDDNDAVSVYKIEIDENCNNGIKLCQLLSYDNFDAIALENFCKEQLRMKNARNDFRKRIQEYVSPENVAENILYLLKDKFLEEGYEENIVDIELNKLNVSISYKEQTEAVEDEKRKHTRRKSKSQLSSDKITPSAHNDIIFEISSPKKKVHAKGIYKDSKMVVLKGSEFTSNLNPSFDIHEISNEIIKKSVKLPNGNYRIEEDVVFNSPSQAAKLIYGCSINGWHFWKTKDNKTLEEIFRQK